MTAHRDAADGGQGGALAWALTYAMDDGLDIFPAAANKQPLTTSGFKDAARDPNVIRAWWRRWPHADPAWALPNTVVVVDLDVKHHKNGIADFVRLEGCDPRDVLTPSATTPSGGLQLFYDAAGKTYQNQVALGGSGIDTRAIAGYVILPAGNGREWVRQLGSTPMLPAPSWLDCALKRERPPVNFFNPYPPSCSSSFPSERNLALRFLERACALIIAARLGARDETRHRQCFLIGALIKDGGLDYTTAYAALRAAAHAMEGSDDWSNLDDRVDYSIKRGMEFGQ
jgi:hypothetical protein